MESSSKVIRLKLLVDSKNQRVLFAEAGKNAVDFLFHILTLPLGTLISLLKNEKMVGCLANLYDSIENLNEAYIQPNQTKDIFLKPIVPVGAVDSSPLFSLPDVNHQTLVKTYYRCKAGCNSTSSSDCVGYVSDAPNAVCPQCNCTMHKMLTYVAPPKVEQQTATRDGELEGGFVKGVVTYMIMDDLVVKPMSTISCIALLNKFNVTEVGSLVEREVDLGFNEVWLILYVLCDDKSSFDLGIINYIPQIFFFVDL